MHHRFRIIEVRVHSFTTDFSIVDLDHENPQNCMALEGFIHHLGALCEQTLNAMNGLEFEVLLPQGAEAQGYDPLDLIGKTIHTVPASESCTPQTQASD
mgnify:CR=1 FL=1